MMNQMDFQKKVIREEYSEVLKKEENARTLPALPLRYSYKRKNRVKGFLK